MNIPLRLGPQSESQGVDHNPQETVPRKPDQAKRCKKIDYFPSLIDVIALDKVSKFNRCYSSR